MEKPTHSLIHKGSISEAINDARRQKKLFVVYISGEDENSILMEQSTWVDQNVHETILRYCVFLHLIEGNADASQFSAIYPQNAIPSISVIAGLNGVMLWHHEGYISAEGLKENIEKSWATFHLQETAATLLATAALATSNPQQAGPASSATHNADVTTASSSNPKSDETPPKENINKKKTPQKDEPRKKDDIAADVTAASSSDPKSSETPQKETINKNIPPTQKNKHQKNDDVTADVTAATESQKDDVTPASSAKSTAEKSKSDEVWVSVKIPEGKSLQTKLAGSAALRSVRDFVGDSGGFVGDAYDLGVPYPRRVFSERDMERSLSELGFANREALIVIPHKSARAKPSFHTNTNDINRDISNSEGYFGHLRRIVSYVNPFSYFGGDYEALNDSTNTERVMSQQVGQSSVNSRNRTGTSTGTRPFGSGSNIHTLRRDNEGSDQNNNRNMFWNGNSTQFGGDNNDNNK